MGLPAYPSPCCKARSEAHRILRPAQHFTVLFRCCTCGGLWAFRPDGANDRPSLRLVRHPEDPGT